jgi:hypothetical protein
VARNLVTQSARAFHSARQAAAMSLVRAKANLKVRVMLPELVPGSAMGSEEGVGA